MADKIGEDLYRMEMTPGLVEPGNIDPYHRPILQNPDGTHSTTRSFSFGTPKGEVLVPQIVGGKLLSQDEAKAHFAKTGEHLGIFDTPRAADEFATWLHNRQEQFIQENKGPK